jgi:hypothetical protein
LQPSSAKCSNEESLIDAHELGHKRWKINHKIKCQRAI